MAMNVDYARATPMLVAENRVFIDAAPKFAIVLHKTASGGAASDIAHFFAGDPNEASTHYVVGQDGAVVQCVREKDGAGGNCCREVGAATFWPAEVKNLNMITISIEHVDPARDNSTPLTALQKAASFALVRDICQRHSIPMRPCDAKGGVAGHYQIAAQSRAHCPGNYPWTELWTYLGHHEPVGGLPAAGSITVLPGWVDDGTVLKAGGFALIKGFREYTLKQISLHLWDPANTPLGGEVGRDPVLMSAPSQGAGTVQLFKQTMLAWTPKLGVFHVDIGTELSVLLGRMSDASQQLNKCKAQISSQQATLAAIGKEVEQQLHLLPTAAS